MQEIKKLKKKTAGSRIERSELQQPGRRLFSRPNVNIPRQSTMKVDEKGSKENSEMPTRRVTRSSVNTSSSSPRIPRLTSQNQPETESSEDPEKSLSRERLNRQFDEFRKQVPVSVLRQSCKNKTLLRVGVLTEKYFNLKFTRAYRTT